MTSSNLNQIEKLKRRKTIFYAEGGLFVKSAAVAGELIPEGSVTPFAVYDAYHSFALRAQ